MGRLVKNHIESEDMYLSKHEVLKMPKKDSWKPDNRLVLITQNISLIHLLGIKLASLSKSSMKMMMLVRFITDFRKLNDMEDSEF